MTLEELLDCSAEKLKSMSDEELTKYFEPYFNITRPERAAKKVTNNVILSPEQQKKIALMKSMGITVDIRKIKR